MTRTPSRKAHFGFAANVGSPSCLQAVGVQYGLISDDCGLAGDSVGTKCEPKTPLVCGSRCRCLQAATNSDIISLPNHIATIFWCSWVIWNHPHPNDRGRIKMSET